MLLLLLWRCVFDSHAALLLPSQRLTPGLSSFPLQCHLRGPHQQPRDAVPHRPAPSLRVCGGPDARQPGDHCAPARASWRLCLRKQTWSTSFMLLAIDVLLIVVSSDFNAINILNAGWHKVKFSFIILMDLVFEAASSAPPPVFGATLTARCSEVWAELMCSDTPPPVSCWTHLRSPFSFFCLSLYSVSLSAAKNNSIMCKQNPLSSFFSSPQHCLTPEAFNPRFPLFMLNLHSSPRPY